MNYNTISYMIYLPITIYITIVVGYQCWKNGLAYVESIFEDKSLANSINNLLLVGYYLINIGYIVLMVSTWNKISGLHQLINELSFRVAGIILILAAMHYINIASLSFFRGRSITKKQSNIN